MTCFEMYNSDNYNHQHKGNIINMDNNPPPPPRISFSNDFVDSQQEVVITRQQNKKASVSSDHHDLEFEFSVANHSMISADELFSKGKLLPLKGHDNNNNNVLKSNQRTIRDELLVSEDDDDDNYGDGSCCEDHEFSLRPPKVTTSASSSTRWNLGLLGLKRTRIGNKKLEDITENSQELLNEADSSCKGVQLN